RACVLRAVAAPRAVVVERAHEKIRGAHGGAAERLVLRLFIGAGPAEAHLPGIEDGRCLLEAQDRALYGAALHLHFRLPLRHASGSLGIGGLVRASAEIVERLDDVA